MRMLVACEFSGTVRRAFAARGHDAWSCDLLPAEDSSPYHWRDDIFHVLCGSRGFGWDLIIAHPPCTHLASSGARWWKDKALQQEEAIEFCKAIMAAPAPRIALENPIGKLSTAMRRPDQIIQPWQFGHGETKATCLWLKGLSPLHPTDVVAGREARVHRMSPGPNRWRERSRTFAGIASAMAEQWG